MNSFFDKAFSTDDYAEYEKAIAAGTSYFVNRLSETIGTVNKADTVMLLMALDIIKSNVIRLAPDLGPIAERLLASIDVPIIAMESDIRPDGKEG